MRLKAIVLLFLLISGIVGVALMKQTRQPSAPTAAVGLEAPDISLPDLDGVTWRLSEHRGRTVFLNFWASWCESCKDEKPSFQALISREKDNPGVSFVTVLYDDDPEKAREFIAAAGYGFRVLIDDRKVSKSYGVRGVPETFIINKAGRVEEKIVGPVRWDSPRMASLLARVIPGR